MPLKRLTTNKPIGAWEAHDKIYIHPGQYTADCSTANPAILRQAIEEMAEIKDDLVAEASGACELGIGRCAVRGDSLTQNVHTTYPSDGPPVTSTWHRVGAVCVEGCPLQLPKEL